MRATIPANSRGVILGATTLFAVGLFAASGDARAQHEGHQPPPTAPPASDSPLVQSQPADEHAAHATEAGHSEHGMAMPLHGFFGSYPMSREASGTSWQPDSAGMHGHHRMRGAWMLMTHGWANAIYSDQGGARGDEKLFATSMLMGMGSRAWRGGTLGVHVMLSADPLLVGKHGYPLLFQTGETADGVTPLVDRQHPHDLLMELAASYSHPFGAARTSSWFVYAGLPGEPALGPPAFMHRFSGVDNPEAPLGHHWLDSTHISFGVLTGGLVFDRFKLDASLFNGREPDEERWDIEVRPLRSESVRVSFNPSARWALQASRGWLDSPEQLEPGVDIERTTASVIYHRAGTSPWEATLAWGRNEKDHAETSDAWLLDVAMRVAGLHTLFARAERVDEDELFDQSHPLHGRRFEVVKLALGYLHRFELASSSLGQGAHWGLGAMVTHHLVPRALEADYGSDPTSFVVFGRIETGGEGH